MVYGQLGKFGRALRDSALPGARKPLYLSTGKTALPRLIAGVGILLRKEEASGKHALESLLCQTLCCITRYYLGMPAELK